VHRPGQVACLLIPGLWLSFVIVKRMQIDRYMHVCLCDFESGFE
jgi:hypothetical protein